MGYLKRIIEKATQNDVFGEVIMGKYKCLIQVGGNCTELIFYKDKPNRRFSQNFEHFSTFVIDIYGMGGRRLEIFNAEKKDKEILINTVKILYPDVNIVLDAEEVKQMWLDAEELSRNGKDDECIVLKDKFQSFLEKLSPFDQEEVTEFLESCGA